MNDLRDLFGDIDIYLFDQLLRGRIAPGMRVLDAGCGEGRNLIYMMRSGYDVAGVDRSEAAIEHVRAKCALLAPRIPAESFRVESVEETSFPDASFDVVISSAVLHFARDDEHFNAMLGEMWRLLAPDGMLFARLASMIGIEERVEPIEGRRYRIPDGSVRYLVDEALLLDATARLGGILLDPIKTVNVQGLRCMTTWCFRKT